MARQQRRKSNKKTDAVVKDSFTTGRAQESGWLKREMECVEREVASWPAWKRARME
jgi:hypothetical protein